MRRLLKIIGWLLAFPVVVILLLLSPVAYVETACHADPEPDSYKPLISEPEFRRPEANTYLTYPEWHIVYAYDGLAETLKTGDEYGFDYISSVRDFWAADCALTRIADRHGGADSQTRMMIATIGVSFTLEMGLKAAYEETVGRALALARQREDAAGHRCPRDGDRLRGLPASDPMVQISLPALDRQALGRFDGGGDARLGAAAGARW